VTEKTIVSKEKQGAWWFYTFSCKHTHSTFREHNVGESLPCLLCDMPKPLKLSGNMITIPITQEEDL